MPTTSRRASIEDVLDTQIEPSLTPTSDIVALTRPAA